MHQNTITKTIQSTILNTVSNTVGNSAVYDSINPDGGVGRNFVQLLASDASRFKYSGNGIKLSNNWHIQFQISTADRFGNIASGNLNAENGIYIDLNSGNIRAFAYVGTTLSTVMTSKTEVTENFFKDKSIQVDIIYEQGDVHLLINGVIEASTTWDLDGNQTINQIGFRESSGGVTATIYDFKYWDNGKLKVFNPLNQFHNSKDILCENKAAFKGPERVINGNFNNISNWSASRGISNLSVVNGKLRATATSGSAFGPVSQLNNLEVGKTYFIKAYAKCNNLSSLTRVRVSESNDMSSAITFEEGGSTFDVNVVNSFVATNETMYIGSIVTNHSIGDYVELDANPTVYEIDPDIPYLTSVNLTEVDTRTLYTNNEWGWLGKELITTQVWLEPFNQSIWVYLPDENVYELNQADSTLNPLNFVPSSLQPETMVLEAERVGGTGDNWSVTNNNPPFRLYPDEKAKGVIHKSVSTLQLFKRASSPTSGKLKRPSLKEVLQTTVKYQPDVINELSRRYYTRLLPSEAGGILLTETISLVGNFKLEAWVTLQDSGYLLGDTNSVDGQDRLVIRPNTSSALFGFAFNATPANIPISYFLNKITVERRDNILVFSINDEPLARVNSTPEYTMNNIGMPHGGTTSIPHWRGIISNFKLETDLDGVILDMALDERNQSNIIYKNNVSPDLPNISTDLDYPFTSLDDFSSTGSATDINLVEGDIIVTRVSTASTWAIKYRKVISSAGKYLFSVELENQENWEGTWSIVGYSHDLSGNLGAGIQVRDNIADIVIDVPTDNHDVSFIIQVGGIAADIGKDLTIKKFSVRPLNKIVGTAVNVPITNVYECVQIDEHKFIGPELIEDRDYLNPETQGVDWTYNETDEYTYSLDSDGTTYQGLAFLLSNEHPFRMRIAGEVTELSGNALAVTDTVVPEAPAIQEVGKFEYFVENNITRAVFKRKNSNIPITATVKRPSVRELFELSQLPTARNFTNFLAQDSAHIVLDKLRQLGTNFEIHVDVFATSGKVVRPIGRQDNYNNRIMINTNDNVNLRNSTGSGNEIEEVDAFVGYRSKFVTIKVIKNGENVSLWVGDDEYPNTWLASDTINFDAIGRNSVGYGTGIIANVKAWKDGNYMTGTKVVDMPIDGIYSTNNNYVENHAITLTDVTDLHIDTTAPSGVNGPSTAVYENGEIVLYRREFTTFGWNVYGIDDAKTYVLKCEVQSFELNAIIQFWDDSWGSVSSLTPTVEVLPNTTEQISIVLRGVGRMRFGVSGTNPIEGKAIFRNIHILEVPDVGVIGKTVNVANTSYEYVPDSFYGWLYNTSQDALNELYDDAELYDVLELSK